LQDLVLDVTERSDELTDYLGDAHVPGAKLVPGERSIPEMVLQIGTELLVDQHRKFNHIAGHSRDVKHVHAND